MSTFRYVLIAVCFVAASCNSSSPDPTPTPGQPGAGPVVEGIRLPEGFEIREYASVPNARAMALSESGVLFVGSMNAGKVYAVVDHDGDFAADTVYTIADSLRMPTGVALRNGDLYVGAVSRILRFNDIERNLATPPAPVVVADDYPTDRHHGWKYIAFGPDGKLYVPVGAPCNVCKRDEEIYASITRMNPDGGGREIVAHGVRNTVGFAWHPETGTMYFTDNGRDMMGDDIPPCELNRLDEVGQHFGFPYLHGSNVEDPEFYSQAGDLKITLPVQNLGPHVAPLGMKFYDGNQFPQEYRNRAFIAEHGSWNRTEKIGYRVTMVTFDGDRAISYQPFADGWLQPDESVTGRPVDVVLMADGSMLVSDDHAGKIYRIAYIGS